MAPGGGEVKDRSDRRERETGTPIENRPLNAIRLIAALLVVLGHIRILFFRDYALEQPSAIKALAFATTSLGGEAVLVFFALSGYWVGGSAARQIVAGRFRWRGFLVNRLSRLWIVLLPALALTAVCDWTGGRLFADADIYRMPSSYAGVPPVPTDTFAVLFGNIAFLQALRMPVFGYNNPLWSLSYEFWYYIAFPGFLISVRRSAS